MVKKLKKQLEAQETVLKYIAEHFVKGILGFHYVSFGIKSLDGTWAYYYVLRLSTDLQIAKKVFSVVSISYQIFSMSKVALKHSS